MRSDFAVSILTHGRPENIVAMKSPERGGYTGKPYIAIDDEDDTADRYRESYGDKVIQFDRLAESKKFDTADLSDDRRAIAYARNVRFDPAEHPGLEYFPELDDDYTDFEYRWPECGKLMIKSIVNPDALFSAMVEFPETSGALSVALAQGGDLIGGANRLSTLAFRERR